ncbi:HNH endonuclease [bacterium]|nr:HNH endonuclease [bacterium]
MREGGKNFELTLLLNSSYEPLKVIHWQRALTLSFLGKAEVVEEYDRKIHAVSLSIKMPAVIRLLKYVTLSRRRPPLTKMNILARDNFRCQYCHSTLNYRSATLDHVVPRSQGGSTNWSNIVSACADCNRKKGSRTPQEAHMMLARRPVQPEWLPLISFKLNHRLPEAWLLFLPV